MRRPAPSELLAAGAAVLAILLVVSLFRWWQRDPVTPEILPPRIDTALVAERATARVLDSVRAANVQREDSIRVAEAAHQRRIAELTIDAVTSARRANDLAAAARTAGDTVGKAWAAYQEEKRRGDTLEVALSVKDSLQRAAEARAQIWRVAHDSADASRRRLLGLTTELREAVDRAARKRPSGWSLGVGAGAGCTISVNGTDGVCGPTVAITIQRRLF